MWCSAADSYLKLLDRVVRSASFLAGGVLECNFAHRRSVAVLCMLFKIKSNPMHPSAVHCLCLMCWLALLVVLWFLIGTRLLLLAVELGTVEPLCPSASHWNDLNDRVFDGVGLAGFTNRANAFLLA